MRRIFIIILFAVLPLSLSAKNKQNEDQLARIVILPFTDNTKSEDYRYLSSSLVDAVGKAMQKKFEYEKVGIGKIKTMYRYETKVLVDNEVKAAAKQVNADIVIYGIYDYDTETNEIIFTVDIYFPKIGEKKTLETVRNPVDGTLFQAADAVADLIVIEINRTVESYETSKSAESDTNDNGKKKKITTGVLKNRKMEVARHLGASWMFLPPVSSNDTAIHLFDLQLLNEKFFTNWFSTHGSFTVGYLTGAADGTSEGYVVKIPMFTALLIFTAPVRGFMKKGASPLGAFPYIDGITFHFRKPGSKSWFALNLGGALGMAYLPNTEEEYYPYLAFESGVQYYVNNRLLILLNATVLVPQYQMGLRFGVLFNLK
ncbi:MAG: hypothetical protein ABUK01_04925 [Leptospirales bacterium]